MFKVGNKVLSSGGRLFDVRDSSIMAIKTTANNTTVTLTVRAYIGGAATILWGDGQQQFVTIPSTGLVGTTTYSHLYSNAGIYTISIASSVEFKQCTCTYAYKYNAGYYKKKLEYILHSGTLVSPQDIIPDYSTKYKYLNVDTGNAIVDVSRLNLENCESFQVKSTATNVVGNPIVSNTSKLVTFYYYNYYISKQNVDLHTLIANNRNLNVLEIAYCNGDLVGYESISDIQLPDTITSFVTYMSTKYNGDGDAIIDKFNTIITFTKIQLMGCLVEGAGLGGNYYSKSDSIYIFNSRNNVGIKGDASLISFKFKVVDFRISFSSSAYGDISNNIGNLNNSNPTQGTYLYLYNYGNVTLDVAKLSTIPSPPITIILGDFTGKWYGDVSSVGNMIGVRNFNLANIASALITNWTGLVDTMYSNRSLFSTLVKTFNCPNVMKAALTGTYQAPAGFVKGSSDGTPTTSREKIYVLVNNYNWSFTNI